MTPCETHVDGTAGSQNGSTFRSNGRQVSPPFLTFDSPSLRSDIRLHLEVVRHAQRPAPEVHVSRPSKLLGFLCSVNAAFW
jgi:hypothetical protein